MASVGVVASIISIWDFVMTVKEFSAKVKGAPEQWRLYCDDLETLAHVQSVIKELTDKSSHIRSIQIKFDGQSQGLVEFANERLRRVKGEAQGILDQFYKPAQKKSRIWSLFSKTRDSLGFALKEEQIESLRKAVEYAKSSLHSAICLAHMAGSESWQQQTGTLLDDIKDHMVKQSKALEELHKTSKLDRMAFKICAQTRELPPPPRSKTSSSKFKTPKIHKRRPALSSNAMRTKGFNSDGLSSKNRVSTGTTTEAGPSRQFADLDTVEPALDDDFGDMDDAVDDDTDDDISISQDQPAGNAVEEDSQESTEKPEYDFICRDGELFMVPEDSEEYKIAASSSMDTSNTGFNLPSKITLANDATQGMTDEEWDEYIQSEPEDILGFLTSAPGTALCSDAEMDFDDLHINTMIRGESDLDSDTETEKGASDREDSSRDDVDHEESPSDSETESHNDEQGQEPRNSSESFAEKVDWDTFIEFMLQMREQDSGDVLFKQAKIWVEDFLPLVPKSYNKDAITWLWVFYKLHMNSEFKKLSAIVQKEVQRPIENEDPFLLPRYIIDRIEEKRVSVLSRVRNLVNSEINSKTQTYLKAVTGTSGMPGWCDTIGVVQSSTMVGYLTLERKRWLRRGQGLDVAFDGASFADVCRHVRSMMNLDHWMVKTVPPSEKMHQTLADLSIFVPFLGAVLRESTLSGGLSGSSTRGLQKLILEMEREDWGIDLA